MKHQLIAAILFGSVTAAGFAQAGQQTFTGVVSDNMCGKQHMAKDKSAAQCTRECVKGGSDYALVVGDKVYTLKGDKAPDRQGCRRESDCDRQRKGRDNQRKLDLSSQKVNPGGGFPHFAGRISIRTRIDSVELARLRLAWNAPRLRRECTMSAPRLEETRATLLKANAERWPSG